MKIDWKKMKRNFKTDLATIIVGLLVLPSFLLGMYGLARICVDFQKYGHSIFEWILIVLAIVAMAWFVGIWIIMLLKKIFPSKQLVDESLSRIP